MILIISHLADEHAVAVTEQLSLQKADFLLFDTSRYPREIRLDMRYQTEGTPTITGVINGETVDFSTVRSVWWRRPQPHNLDLAITNSDDRNFAYGECSAAITGLWSCLNAHWMNVPERDDVAGRKLYQLKVAAALGLIIPATLVTNDPERAKEFIATQGEKGTIYKAFSATERAWRETRLLKTEELEQIEAVRFAPVIFQEHIVADIDLRITVVGGDIFPAEILSGETDYRVDFRMTMQTAEIRPHVLPNYIVLKLKALMQQLGLVYGAIDMRLTANGTYVFLEVNPAGQWLFIEERTGQPITTALVNYLLKHDTM